MTSSDTPWIDRIRVAALEKQTNTASDSLGSYQAALTAAREAGVAGQEQLDQVFELAQTFEQSGDARAAAETGLLAVELGKAVLGAEAPPMAALHELTGNAMCAAGMYMEAAHQYQQGHNLLEGQLDDEDPALLPFVQGFGDALCAAGEYEWSEPPLAWAAEFARIVYGPSDVRTLMRLAAHAQSLLCLERHDEAITRFGEALSASAPSLDPDHELVLTWRHNHAGAVREGGDHARATELFEALIDDLPGGSAEIAEARLELATTLFESGDDDKADRTFRDARTELEAALGPTHAHVCLCLENHAALLDRMGRADDHRALMQTLEGRRVDSA